MIISDRIDLILMIIQHICVLIYVLEFILKVSFICLRFILIYSFKIYTYGIYVYFGNWIYYRMEFILLIFALIEWILEYYYYWKSNSRHIFILLQILIFIQIFRLCQIIEVDIYLFKYCLIFLFYRISRDI
jgi:hypothetical protein